MIAAIKTHTSTCAGREMSHTMRSYLHATMTESVQLCSYLSLPVSVGCRLCMRPRLLPHCAAAAFGVMGHHSWRMLLWKLSYPKSMSAQKEAAGMRLNKHTCIFLAIEATVNNLAKNMDECLYPFKYHHQATRDTNVFAAVVCFFCMCFIREIMSLD